MNCERFDTMFICLNCDKGFNGISLYNKHQKIHYHENVPILCLYPKCKNCKLKLKNYLTFKRHLLRAHVGDRIFVCQYHDCSYRCESSKLLRNHFWQHYENLDNFTGLFCSESRTFNSKRGFEVHLLVYHR